MYFMCIAIHIVSIFLVSTPGPGLSRSRLGLVGWLLGLPRLGSAKMVTRLAKDKVSLSQGQELDNIVSKLNS